MRPRRSALRTSLAVHLEPRVRRGGQEWVVRLAGLPGEVRERRDPNVGQLEPDSDLRQWESLKVLEECGEVGRRAGQRVSHLQG